MSKSFEYLKRFGLTEKQINIYLSLLKSGPSTIMNLSRRLNMNRSTVHVLVDELIYKGIIDQIKEDKKRKVRALPPERFKDIIDEEIRLIRSKETILPTLVESIYKDTAYIQDSAQTQVRYYNTVESIDWLYDKILESKEVRTYVNSTEIIKVFPDNWQRFFDAVVKGVKIWDFHHYSSFVDNRFYTLGDIYPNYHIKSLPPSVNFESMDYLLYDGKIAIIFGFPRPYAIEIENEFYYKIAKELYDFTWSVTS